LLRSLRSLRADRVDEAADLVVVRGGKRLRSLLLSLAARDP
jgi:geranylgeranyl pyrophosphate synthase